MTEPKLILPSMLIKKAQEELSRKEAELADINVELADKEAELASPAQHYCNHIIEYF